MFKKINKCEIISIIGLAKNVGKTTALNYFLKNYENCGVTTIGVDGEESCTVDGIKKPEIYLKKNTLFTTVEQELKNRRISARIVKSTNILTPLGRVIISKVVVPDFFEIYGCGSTKETECVVREMINLGAKKVFIDGAFFRKSPAKISSGCILVTGSNVKAGMEEVVWETKKVVEFLNFQKVNFKKSDKVCLAKNGVVEELEICSLIGNENLVCEKSCGGATQLFIPGAFTSKSYEMMKKKNFKFSKIRIILTDPTKCLLTKEEYAQLINEGGKISVIHPVNLCGVVVNSFSTFLEDFNPKKFLERMRGEIKPVEVHDLLLKCS